MTESQNRRDEVLRISLLVALCLCLFFFRLGTRDLWDIDEGTHAVVARNIVTSGDWITPTFNGENFYDKPILFSWLGAVAFKVLGFTELAARLPGALLSIATVLVTYLLGRSMFGPTTGLLVALPWRDLLAGGSESLRKAFGWSALLAPAVLAGVLAWVAVDPPYYAEARVGLRVGPIVLFLVVAMLFVVLAFWLLRLRRPVASFAAHVLLSVVGVVIFSLVITPPIGPYKGTRELGVELADRLPVGERMVMYNRMRHSALFYTGREAVTLHHRDRLVGLLQSERREYCLISHQDLEKNRELVEGLYTVLADLGGKYLISNRPDP